MQPSPITCYAMPETGGSGRPVHIMAASLLAVRGPLGVPEGWVDSVFPRKGRAQSVSVGLRPKLTSLSEVKLSPRSAARQRALVRCRLSHPLQASNDPGNFLSRVGTGK
ncbi:hypothetical protein NDU88_010231 [Pleurodeles waltl]|uniref:Uncharacterized protein n=1 Tax=Pleurodeles waltl TaxID=8319 RepID=A0AAV7QY32_PLEWA|nr:hypothetical protein NDU88_010231 [Pleurodeles waltl]